MTTGTEQPNRASLYRKIAAVAGAIEAVEKDGRNKDQGYRYATPASVMSAIKPLLSDHKLAIVPHLVDFAEIDTGQRAGSGKPFILNRVSMHYHILDGESGEEIVVPWQAQAGTYGDDKGLAKAQTIALRTFLIQLFQIPAEDPEIDPDARDARDDSRTSQQRQPAQRTPQRPQATRPQQARPAQNGASYESPPTTLADIERDERVMQKIGPLPDAPANGKKPPTKEGVIKRIRALWREERSLGGKTPTSELTTDLEALNLDQLIEAGKRLAERVEKLRNGGPRPDEVFPEETEAAPVSSTRGRVIVQDIPL